MPGIYIHIPFCLQRCHYCDFYSTIRLDDRNLFYQCLIKELGLRKDFINDEKIDTVYFGGGTPSVVSPSDISGILKEIKGCCLVAGDAEISLEANPDDMSREYLDELAGTEVNRLSVGIQSFNDSNLVMLNRRHSAGQAIDAINKACEYGFTNLSIDLIYGLPGQTAAGWTENLKTAVSLPVDHISAYHLSYEKGTRFYKWLKKGRLEESKEELSLELFETAVEILGSAGFEHYEISNFARNGMYSRHNTAYWLGEKYLGLGPSAHSYNGIIRQWNVSNLDKWMKGCREGVIDAETENIDIQTRRNEMIMTRLRTQWGISESEYISVFGQDSWHELMKMAGPFISEGLMTIVDKHLIITNKGKFLSDGIISNLFIV